MLSANRALAESSRGRIAADTTRGLVTIRREPPAGGGGDVAFLVRFVPRDRGGRLDAARAVEVGSYDDLDTAVTIAALGYGVTEAGWTPAGEGAGG